MIVIDFAGQNQQQGQQQQIEGIPNSESGLTEVMMSRESSQDSAILNNDDSGTGMNGDTTASSSPSSIIGNGTDGAGIGATLLSFGKELAPAAVQKRSSKDLGAAAPGRVAEWQRQQQEERRSRTSLDNNGLPPSHTIRKKFPSPLFFYDLAELVFFCFCYPRRSSTASRKIAKLVIYEKGRSCSCESTIATEVHLKKKRALLSEERRFVKRWKTRRS